MFTKNESHIQQNIFSIESQLPKSKRKKLQNSPEMYFYQEIFCNIKEENFSSIAGDISIHENSSLTSLAGLENLCSIGGTLSISDNINLANLASLINLSSIGNSIYINGNNLLSLGSLMELQDFL